MTKKIYKVHGMHCTSCATVIESDLEDTGVKARCNYARETLEIEFDPQKVSESAIKNTVVAAGYQLTE